MSGGLDPAEIALRARIAALLEVCAPKPGNVSRYQDFADAPFEDFLMSAAAMGDALGAAGETGVGVAVDRAVIATRRWVASNTNLGVILLFAPLARAAAASQNPLRSRLSAVLAGLTIADAEAVYRAMRLARPGGLGVVEDQDVAGTPTVTLRAAMALAADRDAIAREYGTDYAATFEVGVPALRRARAAGAAWPDAVTGTFLTLLAAAPDTLIARKRGMAVAAAVSERAAAVLASGAPGEPARAAALARMDRELRADGNALNPGTTADLVAASLFVLLLEDGPGGQE